MVISLWSAVLLRVLGGVGVRESGLVWGCDKERVHYPRFEPGDAVQGGGVQGYDWEALIIQFEWEWDQKVIQWNSGVEIKIFEIFEHFL